jgi:hypothetical protein
VKIIDEYNRIPTKTQSALLSLLSEGYAEMFDQYVYAGRSSWFLTANDDAGGGTFQVIEALKDRIDVVVRAVPSTRGFLARCCSAWRARPLARGDDAVGDRVHAGGARGHLRRHPRGGGAAGRARPHELFPRTARFLPHGLAAVRVQEQGHAQALGRDGGAGLHRAVPARQEGPHLHPDGERRLGAQLPDGAALRQGDGVFPRRSEVEVEDLRQIMPWVLHEKLVPNARSPFFEGQGKPRTLLQDRVAWIRNMLDMALEGWPKHEPLRMKVRKERDLLDAGLTGVDLKTTQKRIGAIAALMKDMVGKTELGGAVYEDLIHLKSMYSRYQNYAAWLRTTSKP